MTDDEAPQDRRRSRRIRASIRVLFTRAGTSVAIESETDDISVDGAFVRTRRRPPDVGTKLGLILKLDDVDQELMLSGVVARVRETDTESMSPGMGIQFLDMDDDTRNTLVRVLEGTDAFRASLDADRGE